MVQSFSPQDLRRVEFPGGTCVVPGEPTLFISRGKGSEVWDQHGQRYIDLCAGFGSLALGHNHTSLEGALRQHLADNGLTQGYGDLYPNQHKIPAMGQLLSFLNKPQHRVGYVLSGAQAVDFAMKTARLATSGQGFISFAGGYHGLDSGPLCVTAGPQFRGPFSGWLQEDKVRILPWGATPDQVGKACEELEAVGGLAGIIVEPIQGRGGVRPASTQWIRQLRNQAAAAGGLLILDEVFTGLGRIGVPSLAEERDISCFGKILGGGMPLAAVVAHADIMSSWPDCAGEALHTGTFFGHPLSLLVSQITLETVMEERLLERSVRLGRKWRSELSQILGRTGAVQIRGSGLMVGIDLGEPGAAVQACSALQAQGLLAVPSGLEAETIELCPALNISEALVDEATAILARQLGGG